MLPQFKDIETYLNYQYYESCMCFWIPIYKKQVFKAKLTNNQKWLLAIKENIYKNIHLKDYRIEILRELGIYHLI